MIGRPKARWRGGLVVAGALLVLAGAGALGFRMWRTTVAAAMGEGGPVVPTARVAQQPFGITVHMTGEIRAASQQVLTAPPVGTSLRILSLVDSGEVVTAGDVIASFDPADQRYNLEQALSELQEAEQTILKRRADIGVQEASDEVALLTARFNVRRAELDAAVDRDLIPANEYQIRQVSLQEARQTLEKTEQDVKARATVNSAGLSVLDETRRRAEMSAARARQNMEMLEIRAPIDGVVSVRDNMDSTTVFFSGMTLPPYRVGDLVNPGRPIIDLFDVSGLEIRASVNEQDRVNVQPGQKVRVTSDSVAGASWTATVQTLSGLGQQRRNVGPLRMFDVVVALDGADARLLPGTTVMMEVEGPRLDEALVLPRQAVFEREGKPTVFVRTGTGFEAREVKVVQRSESRAAIEGLDVDTEVALIEPDGAAAATASSGPATVGAGPASPAMAPPPPPGPAVAR